MMSTCPSQNKSFVSLSSSAPFPLRSMSSPVDDLPPRDALLPKFEFATPADPR
ncbi:hypothetical protein BGW80DRAFT_1353573 [Lactifluus volemus]|nr:hypothetical protein BGW80DRAFT_1353573 [Lactifluus volemus]